MLAICNQMVCAVTIVLNSGSHPHQEPEAIQTRVQHCTRTNYTAKMVFRHKRTPAHAQHLANKLSNPTLCQVLLCGYTTLHLKNWVFQGNKPYIGLNYVTPRPASWNDGNHLMDMGPNTLLMLHCPNRSLHTLKDMGWEDAAETVIFVLNSSTRK